MSWLALLVLGVAVTDLLRSARPAPVVPEAVGAASAVLVGLACGLTRPGDAAALALVVVVVVAWGRTGWSVTERPASPIPAWLPLAVLGGGLVVLLVCSVWAPQVTGPFAQWLPRSQVPVISGQDPATALLAVALLLAQLSTGNTIVRLMLLATGTVSPTTPAGEQASAQLKGGRLLGPMERLFILGLGIAGHVTAASIVIAAKGLLRFPELQAKRDQVVPTDIDKVTEYFLVGSFLSWLVALGSLVLLSGR